MLVPRFKGSRIARLVETSNAESPTPMNIYITLQGHTGYTNDQCGLYINIPRGVTVALFLTNRFEFARFLNRQNQSVQLRLFMICVMPASTLRGFQQWH